MLNNLLQKFKNMNTKKKTLIISIIILVVLILISSIYYFVFAKGTHSNIIGENNTGKSISTPTPTLTSQKYNFLNGELLTDDQYLKLSVNRPMAVMIPNDTTARPQFGVNKADVVYEALTEGNITRYMGIYWSNQNNYKLMPIRSIRNYFLEWLLEYNDIIVMHTGYAQTDNPKTDALSIIKNYDVKTLIFDYSWKYDDPCSQTRPGYNCSYAYSQDLWNLASNKHGWTGASWQGLSVDSQWKFKDEGASSKRGTMNKVTIPFLYKDDASTTTWQYNKSTNEYLKFDYKNQAMLDELDKTQLNAKTLVVQMVPYAASHDEKGRSIQDVIGSGKAYVFVDGNTIEATWKKADIKSRTRFYDKNGSEISFDRGRIWISVIPDTQTINIVNN